MVRACVTLSEFSHFLAFSETTTMTTTKPQHPEPHTRANLATNIYLACKGGCRQRLNNVCGYANKRKLKECGPATRHVKINTPAEATSEHIWQKAGLKICDISLSKDIYIVYRRSNVTD